MMAEPEVLSMVVPALIVNVPATVPRALELLISNVPPLKVTPLVKVLTPDKISVPDPASVRLCVPLIIPPSVKVLAVIVTVGSELKVTAPVPKFKLELPVNV